MAKSKNFREWMHEEQDSEVKFKKRDGKRYDKKKAAVQKARKNKRKMKNSFFDG